jgi:hypothetical protein
MVRPLEPFKDSMFSSNEVLMHGAEDQGGVNLGISEEVERLLPVARSTQSANLRHTRRKPPTKAPGWPPGAQTERNRRHSDWLALRKELGNSAALCILKPVHFSLQVMLAVFTQAELSSPAPWL